MRFNWAYRNIRTIVLFLSEYHDTVHQCEQCVILAHTNILTWVVYGTTLTNQDVTSFSELTTENLNTESLTCGLTTILGTSDSFFVCHFPKSLKLSDYVFNFQLSELLTVTVQLTVTFSSLLVEDQNLVTLNERRNNLSDNLSA